MTIRSGMADHTGMTDHNDGAAAPTPRPGPDYELADELEIDDPAQYKAVFEPTRREIVALLLERAATTSELAVSLDKPKGTIGHHLKVLEEAGLVRVVRTKQVRALEAKYYGRTARLFLYRREHDAVGEESRLLAKASTEISQSTDVGHRVSAELRYVRIPDERAREWKDRLDALLIEFAAEPRGGETTYGLVYGLYATGRKRLDSAEDDEPSNDHTEPPAS